jgi:pimeloyl-ACP methyl ester carboxylesterase
MWSDQLQQFSEKYRTITYDIRGFGESEEGSEDFSIDLFVKDLLNFMEALQLEKSVIIGFSMGGYIVLRALQQFPDKIMGLVLVDTQCQADTEIVYERRMKSCQAIRQQSLSRYADELLPAMLDTIKRENCEVVVKLRKIIEKTSKDSLCNALIAMAHRDATCHSLKDIAIPTLILVGENDPITPIEKSVIMNSEITGAAMQIIPNAKHLSNIDNPEEFNRHVTSFLQTIQKERSHLPARSEMK